MEATSCYYQIGIEEKEKKKPAFRWKDGFYEFNRMPFGLCNAPATFKSVFDTILNGIIGKFAFVYLDDIVVYSKTKEDHISHLNMIMERLKEAGISLNKAKCKFAISEIKFLRNVVSGATIKPDEQKVEAINNFKKPVTIRELRPFLGLLN